MWLWDFIKYQTLSNKITKHKIKIWWKPINSSKFFFLIFSKISIFKISRKFWRHVLLLVFVNWIKIINVVLSVKLGEEIGFLPDSLEAYVFYANRFLYDLQKKFKNKNFLYYSYTYFLYRMFFSKVNNKTIFGGGR